MRASVFNLQPPASPVEPCRAQGWAHARSWGTRTVIESGHWKAGGPGLKVLCFLQNVEDCSSCAPPARRGLLSPVLSISSFAGVLRIQGCYQPEGLEDSQDQHPPPAAAAPSVDSITVT